MVLYACQAYIRRATHGSLIVYLAYEEAVTVASVVSVLVEETPSAVTGSE